MQELLDRCLYVLQLITESAVQFWDWLFTELDGGILGTIMPIQLISFGLVLSFLIARIVLAFNQ